jgi:hypothetical protein
LWFRSSSQSPPSPPMCFVDFHRSHRLPWARVGYPVVIEDILGLFLPRYFLSRRHFRSGMASESLNEVRFILTRRHRVPEKGDKYIDQGRCPPQSTSLPPPHGITIWSQFDINFLSSGLPQMHKV